MLYSPLVGRVRLTLGLAARYSCAVDPGLFADLCIGRLHALCLHL